MRFYFSGVESLAELKLLREAKVSRILVDPTQLSKLDGYLEGLRIALDSGAYRIAKQGGESSLVLYAQTVERWVKRGYTFDFVTGLDVLDDPDGSFQNWEDLGTMGIVSVPVYHLGEDPRYLERYLTGGMNLTDWIGGIVDGETLNPEGDVVFWDLFNRYRNENAVGIGGLARTLYTKAPPGHKHRTRAEVGALCGTYPDRFRLFGACDLPLLNRVKDLVLSADSSFWLRGRRRYSGFYHHTNTGLLSEAPPWLLRKLAGEYPEINKIYKMTGTERSIHNARLLEQEFNRD